MKRKKWNYLESMKQVVFLLCKLQTFARIKDVVQLPFVWWGRRTFYGIDTNMKLSEIFFKPFFFSSLPRWNKWRVFIQRQIISSYFISAKIDGGSLQLHSLSVQVQKGHKFTQRTRAKLFTKALPSSVDDTHKPAQYTKTFLNNNKFNANSLHFKRKFI